MKPISSTVLRAFVAAAVSLSVSCDGPGVHAQPGGEAAAEPPKRTPEEILADLTERMPMLLAEYVRTDTVNPPGNETEGAKFLAGLLEGGSIETRIVESQPSRGNLIARLEGSGKKRPVVLASHIDVVPADDAWTKPAFDGVTEDGVFYGRGALDCKGVGLVHALALRYLDEAGIELDRDIVVLATADEETGGTQGVGWLLENEPGAFEDAEFVISEGGFIVEDGERPLAFDLKAAEKGPCWFRVVAKGDPGHASRPADETAVSRLIAALAKLEAWERPLRVGPVVAGYFAAYASLDPERARQFRQLERSLDDDDFRETFLADPVWSALVQHTVTPTVLAGSTKTNIVPGEAFAEVDSRLLPGTDCGEFLDEVTGLIGGEYVSIEPSSVRFESTQSPLANDLTEAIERLAAAESREAVVLPGLTTGFTDSRYFRAAGIDAYGFSPIVVTRDERAAIHGPDERVRIDELKAALGRMIALLEDVAGK